MKIHLKQKRPQYLYVNMLVCTDIYITSWYNCVSALLCIIALC